MPGCHYQSRTERENDMDKTYEPIGNKPGEKIKVDSMQGLKQSISKRVKEIKRLKQRKTQESRQMMKSKRIAQKLSMR